MACVTSIDKIGGQEWVGGGKRRAEGWNVDWAVFEGL